MKVFRSKRALVFQKFLLPIIVFVIVLTLTTIIYSQIGDKQDEIRKRDNCKLSVNAAARLQSLPFGDDKAKKSFNCPTEYVSIKKDKAKSMNKEVADLMAECWDNFGQGKLTLFKATDNKFCVICSVFEFDDKKTKLPGLDMFMIREKVPRTISPIRQSYYQFLTGSAPDNNAPTPSLAYFDGSKRYSVLYTFYRLTTWAKVKKIAWASTSSATLAGAGGIVLASSGGAAAPLAATIVSPAISATKDAVQTVSSPNSVEPYLIVTEYSTQALGQLGCDSLPISQLNKEFH